MLNTDFICPDWFSAHFPLHRWMTIPNSHNNQSKNNPSTPFSNQRLTVDTVNVNERLNDISSIRQAHYIEWFTQRDFYNNRDKKIPSTTASLQQGLYFVKLPAQQHYDPLVILRTPNNTGQDKAEN